MQASALLVNKDADAFLSTLHAAWNVMDEDKLPA
jgi:hypothetical protein